MAWQKGWDNMTQIECLKNKLETTDTIIIGAGAGLSTFAGFTYSGERFRKYFSDFEDKYGFHDMYAGGFYPYSIREEYWAYWMIPLWRMMTANPKAVYACANYGEIYVPEEIAKSSICINTILGAKEILMETDAFK